MIITRADATEWRVADAFEKLRLRAGLPGARMFDLAAAALRKARDAGMPTADRLALALPASWCVNSPAPSTVLRRWILPPQSEVWLALVDVLEQPRQGPLDAESCSAIEGAFQALGQEAFLVEAVSKVLALLVPDVVPLMPVPARRFALGSRAEVEGAPAFIAIVNWFVGAVAACGAELASSAALHSEVSISAAQALDRLLWFDSEGHRHFPPVGSSSQAGSG